MAEFQFNTTPTKVSLIETEFRQIRTPLPVPESLGTLQKLYTHEVRSMHSQLPMVWDSAEGFQVKDRWGNQWIDFTSTIFVANAGHGNQRIRDSLTHVINKPLLHSYNYATVERADYLEYLLENTPGYLEKVFLLSSGTESTEAAYKLMRLHAAHHNKARGGIVCFEGAYHGRTTGAQMMTGNVSAKRWIGYHDPNIYHLPFPYPWQVSESAGGDHFLSAFDDLCRRHNLEPKNDIAGFMIETFQGWGAIFYPESYMKRLSDLAKQHNMLMCFDEMQAGFGRTGKLFGYEHYGVEPDLVCCGKGSSSSLPLSFVIGRAPIMDLPPPGTMSSTHSANPLTCVAGKGCLQALIEDRLIDNSKTLGVVLHEHLARIKVRFKKHIAHLGGRGLLAGVIFKHPTADAAELCSKIVEKAFHKGLLLVHTGREAIKIAPPLCISREALVEGVQVFEESISEVLDIEGGVI